MKNMIISILAIVLVFATISGLSAGNDQAGPYLSLGVQLTPQVVKGPVTFNKQVKAGVGKCDGASTTNTVMKTVVFTATAVGNGAAVVFGTGYFTSALTYWVSVSEVGTTFNASACSVRYDSGNSCTVYTNGVSGVVKGVAIGY